MSVFHCIPNFFEQKYKLGIRVHFEKRMDWFALNIGYPSTPRRSIRSVSGPLNSYSHSFANRSCTVCFERAEIVIDSLSLS